MTRSMCHLNLTPQCRYLVFRLFAHHRHDETQRCMYIYVVMNQMLLSVNVPRDRGQSDSMQDTIADSIHIKTPTFLKNTLTPIKEKKKSLRLRQSFSIKLSSDWEELLAHVDDIDDDEFKPHTSQSRNSVPNYRTNTKKKSKKRGKIRRAVSEKSARRPNRRSRRTNSRKKRATRIKRR